MVTVITLVQKMIAFRFRVTPGDKQNVEKQTVVKRAIIGFLLILMCRPNLILADDITIVVTGNTRTRTSYIENIVNDYLFRGHIIRPHDVDTKKLKDLIVDTELFSDVDVSVTGNQIDIRVKDRWTLIPIPIVIAQTDQDTQFGFFLMERNLLGYGKLGVMGGLFSQSQTNFFLMYQDQEVAFTDWMLGARISANQAIQYLFDGEDKVYGDDRKVNSVFISGGYKLSEKFEAALETGFTSTEYETLASYDRPEDYAAVEGGFTSKWDDATFRYYYNEGWMGRMELKHQLHRNDETPKRYTLGLQVVGDKTVYSRQVLQVMFSGAYLGGGDERDLMRVGGKRGFRGIPDAGAWVDGYAAVAVDYQVPLWSGRMGTWTVAPFCDTGYLNQPAQASEGVVRYTSWGLGTYLFLRQVASPGVGVQVGHNDAYQDTFFHITIGFSI